MQIIKKRLSVHRTGKILRNLWAEYLQNDANGSGDAARLQTLSSFMENILDADAQLPTIMDELFEDISVIITGLLDVAQRSALQLREQWNSLDTSERSTLGDALRKTLLVGELCLREEKNREQIVSAHGIVSRISADVISLRDSLERAEKADSRETIVDILRSLKGVNITFSVLKSTKVYVTVKSVKQKCSEDREIVTLAKELIQKWKEIYNKSKDLEPPAQAEQKSQTPSAPKPAVKTDVVLRNSNLQIDDYPEGRKKILSVFIGIFKELDSDIAEGLGYGIESSLNELHPFGTDIKSYQWKARKLISNLKNNAELRRELSSGSLSVQSLVRLPASALATRDQLEERNQASAEAEDSRRSDWKAAHRNEIMKENGLDPTKGTEFKCFKCKQTKTTFYALQTRSSDEPMTLFVTCLTCGNRWRTE